MKRDVMNSSISFKFNSNLIKNSLEVNQFKIDALKAQNKYQNELELLEQKLKECEM